AAHRRSHFPARSPWPSLWPPVAFAGPCPSASRCVAWPASLRRTSPRALLPCPPAAAAFLRCRDEAPRGICPAHQGALRPCPLCSSPALLRPLLRPFDVLLNALDGPLGGRRYPLFDIPCTHQR